jgi:hypothetical protein
MKAKVKDQEIRNNLWMQQARIPIEYCTHRVMEVKEECIVELERIPKEHHERYKQGAEKDMQHRIMQRIPFTRREQSVMGYDPRLTRKLSISLKFIEPHPDDLHRFEAQTFNQLKDNN